MLVEDSRRLRDGTVGAAVSVLTDRSLSIGVAQEGDGPVAQRARARGWDLVRRTTGGTGVLHDRGDIVWSLVLPRADPRVGRDYVAAYARLGRGVTDTLVALGADAAWRPSRGLSGSCCFLGDRGWALEVGGRVVGGAAQHLTTTHLLHQGAISLRLDRGAAAAIFDLDPEVVDRNLGALEGLVNPPELTSDALAHQLALRLAAWVDESPA